MKYTDYSADDLIKDEFFQQWVFSPTEESNRFWLDFLQNYPDHREKVDEARQFLSFFHVKENDVFEARVGNLKKRINHSVDDPKPIEDPLPKQPQANPVAPKVSKIKTSRLVILATVFLAGVLAIIYAFLPDHTSSPAPMHTSSEEVVFARKGKRNVVALPDGTKVWLNAESQLIYPKNIDSLTSRIVTLSGEAFFQVSENLQRPFVVRVGDVTITGYAASFDVKAHPSTKTIEAFVLAGRVRIEHKDHPLIKTTISPEQSATLDLLTNSLSVDNNVNAELSSAWRVGVLYFREQPFSQILISLERWYDVNIQLEDSTSYTCHFTGELNNKTLRETLDLFVKDKPASYLVNGSDVVIKGKLCP
ncbi:FecR family protein [Pseudochryseolinea flava]|nr:FecR family protein [Pseudochryseolinea flava]